MEIAPTNAHDVGQRHRPAMPKTAGADGVRVATVCLQEGKVHV